MALCEGSRGKEAGYSGKALSKSIQSFLVPQVLMRTFTAGHLSAAREASSMVRSMAEQITPEAPIFSKRYWKSCCRSWLFTMTVTAPSRVQAIMMIQNCQFRRSARTILSPFFMP